jgi:hypothetical protein
MESEAKKDFAAYSGCRGVQIRRLYHELQRGHLLGKFNSLVRRDSLAFDTIGLPLPFIDAWILVA